MAAILTSLPSARPSGRLTRVYNTRERAVIDPFKERYMEASSSAARKTIAIVHIFPALFNYWASVGKVVDDKDLELRSTELLIWIRNLWRKPKTATSKEGTRYRLTDALWWAHQPEIFQEIASIMNIDSANTETSGWFQHRTAASKNILNRMSENEKQELRTMRDRMAIEGLPVEQQRKYAETKWYQRLSKQAKENYIEMGLVSISFVVYTDTKGQVVIDIHDDITKHYKCAAKQFEETYEDKVTDMKRTVMEYIKVLKGNVPGAGAIADDPKLSIQLDPEGFPIAPCPASWDKVTKQEIERLYRTYITTHYQLATGDMERQAPFTRIAQDPSNFVQRQYIPRGINLDDPRTMKREAVIKFFNHVGERQSSHGVPDAFRFKAVLSSRKKGLFHEAFYTPVTNTPAATPTVIATTAAPARIHIPAPTLTPAPAQLTSNMFNRINLSNDAYPSNSGNYVAPSQPSNQNLTLDPAFNVDPQVHLDPSLDPALQFTSQNGYLDSTWQWASQNTLFKPNTSTPMPPATPDRFSFKFPVAQPSTSFLADPAQFNPAQYTHNPATFTHAESSSHTTLASFNTILSPLSTAPDMIRSAKETIYPATSPSNPVTAPVIPAPSSSIRRKGKNADKLAIEEAQNIIGKRKTRR